MEENVIVEPKRPFRMFVWARILLSLVGVVVMVILLGSAVSLLFKVRGLIPVAYISDFAVLFGSLAMLVSVLLVTWLFRRYIDRESYRSLGFDTRGIVQSAYLAGAVLFGVMVLGTAILATIGSVSVSFQGISRISMAIYLVTFISVAFTEEIFFRGYILNNLLQKVNRFWALTISSVLFGLMHSVNPNVQVLPIVNIILAGYLLGATYIYTRNLWYPIILHFLWNFMQGPVLGYHVSGTTTQSIFATKPLGAAWVNGGAFGFEGSIVCTVLCLVAVAVILRHYRTLAASGSLTA